MSAKIIDVSPLPAPVNACRWNAAQLRATLKQVQLPEPQRQQLEHSARWLDELGKVVDFAHANPVLLLAVGNLVLNVKDRGDVLAALKAIEEATIAAQGGGQNGGAGKSPWAAVE